MFCAIHKSSVLRVIFGPLFKVIMTRSFSELHLNTHGLLPNGRQNMDCAKVKLRIHIWLTSQCLFGDTVTSCEMSATQLSSQKVLNNGQHAYILKQGLFYYCMSSIILAIKCTITLKPKHSLVNRQ